MIDGYGAGHVELYDVLYAEKPYDAEAAWVTGEITRVLGRAPASLLEVACGTGRHAASFAERGLAVTGLDVSAAMIEVARRRCPSSRFELGDMTCIPHAGSFDAVTCLFDSLGYARTNEAVLSTLRGFARAAKPGGVIVVEVWHAAAMLAGFERARVRRLRIGEREIVRLAETSLDVEAQLARVHYSFFEDGAPVFEETHVNRFFLAGELGLFFANAGLTLRSVRGGFGDFSVDAGAFHLIAVGTRS